MATNVFNSNYIHMYTTWSWHLLALKF